MPEFTTAPVATQLNDSDSLFVLQQGVLKKLPPSILILKSQKKDRYNVHDYGAKGNGTSDDTAAIQAIINTISVKKNNSVLIFPEEGPYIISGSLQDTGRANCQIKFPSVGINERQYAITLQGAERPTFSPSVYNTVPLPSGTKIKSTLATGGGTMPCMFGGMGPVGGAHSETSYMAPGFEDLIIQTVPNPLISAVDLYHYTNTFFKDVHIIAGNTQGVLDSTPPTVANSWGVRQPYHSSGINQRVEGVLNILGFYNGIHVGEGAQINDLGIWSCRYALNYEFSYGASAIKRCIIGWSPHHIRVSGEHCFDINELSMERKVSGGGVEPQWFDWVTDLIDLGDVAQGEIRYRTVVANVGHVPGGFTAASGGTKMYIHEIGKP